MEIFRERSFIVSWIEVVVVMSSVPPTADSSTLNLFSKSIKRLKF